MSGEAPAARTSGARLRAAAAPLRRPRKGQSRTTSRRARTRAAPVQALGGEAATLDPVACLSTVFDVAFHPGEVSGRSVLCAALVTGEVQIFARASAAAPSSDFSFVATVRNLYGASREASCRTVAFDDLGSVLYTGGSSGALHGVDAARGDAVWSARDAHAASVNRVSTCLSRVHGAWALLSGDEDGEVKLWDARTDGRHCAAKSSAAHADYVSDLVLVSDTSVATTGGDGTLAVHDLRKLKTLARSVELETELLSALSIKDGAKLLVGTQLGTLDVWTAGAWERPADTFPGHPHSVDCLLKVDESTVLTGSSDGMIRVVSVHPNRVLGVIGFHDDFPVERMSWSADRRLVATCSHDELVRLWDTSFLVEAGAEEELRRAALGAGEEGVAEVEGGGDDDDEDDDDEDMDDEEEEDMDDAADARPRGFFSGM